MSFFHFPHTANTGLKFFISWRISSHQRVLPLFLSILTAYFILFGTLSPYLWVFTQYSCVLESIWYILFSTFLVHHENAGSNKNLFWTAYSTICTGCKSLIYLLLFHVVPPSFHWMQIYNPLIIFFFVWYQYWLWKTHLNVMFVYSQFLCWWWTWSVQICCLLD